ncbi:hypothetical protein A3K63_03285 [Candidatus Micrarchaeota archaeon RBG_16_49_10]|nr:MAG: hypothetical protein A3K63_03285 [Candidatus Micrarchaeota archaeon RBG_16_49_10]
MSLTPRLQVRTTQYNNYDVVKVVGYVFDDTKDPLDSALRELTNAGRYRIVLDLSELDFMSAAGVKLALNAQRECKRHEGELAIAKCPKRTYDALEVAGFIPLFSFYETVESASEKF